MRRDRLNSRVTIAAAVVFAVAIAAFAQSIPTFRATTETVLVPTSVLDKEGRPVRGLKLGDFAVRVDGKSVAIEAISEVIGRSSDSIKTQPLPPGVLTNLPPGERTQSSWVVLLVDFINTDVPDRMTLRKQLLEFLSKDLKPGQQIAIYALSHSLSLVHPFTSDTQPLVEAATRLLSGQGVPAVPGADTSFTAAPMAITGLIAPAPGGYSAAPMPGGGQSGQGAAQGDIDSFLLSSQWRTSLYTTRARAEDTLAQFRQLANSFAGVAGKKTVLWLTGDASPLNPTMLNMINLDDPSSEPLRIQWREISSTYEALNAAGISLFPVDIRGALNPGLAKADEASPQALFGQLAAGTQPGANGAYPTLTSQRQGEAANAELAMSTAAVETGGQMLAGDNDLSSLLGRARNLWSSYYVLSFAPPPESQEKEPVYHRIEVKAPGHSGQVLYRRGYLSRPEKLIASKEELRHDVTEATTSPVDLTAIPLTLRLAPADKSALRTAPQFTLAIPAAALSRSDSPKGTRYNFSLFIVLKNSNGKVLSELGDKIDRVFPPREAAGILQHGFVYPGQFDISGGAKTFGRIIVRDNFSGRVGTLTVQIGRD